MKPCVYCGNFHGELTMCHEMITAPRTADVQPTPSVWTIMWRYHGGFISRNGHYVPHRGFNGQRMLIGTVRHITWSTPAFTVDTTTN